MLHTLATYAMNLASAMFLVGLAGSSIVVLISFVEDFVELFSKNDDAGAAHTHTPAS
jgi:hypothetical protein